MVLVSQYAGFIALGLSLAAVVPYVIETLRGNVRPERVSYLIWTLLGVVFFWSAIRENGAVLFTLAELIGPIVIFIVALKWGVGGKSRFDMMMLVLALLAIGWLLLAESSLMSLVLALTADSIALVLTIRKLHIDPASESRWSWGIFAVAGLFALLSLTVYTVETMAYPVYATVGSVYIVWLTHPSQHHKNKELDSL